jgi:hypothetical protein
MGQWEFANITFLTRNSQEVIKWWNFFDAFVICTCWKRADASHGRNESFPLIIYLNQIQKIYPLSFSVSTSPSPHYPLTNITLVKHQPSLSRILAWSITFSKRHHPQMASNMSLGSPVTSTVNLHHLLTEHRRTRSGSGSGRLMDEEPTADGNDLFLRPKISGSHTAHHRPINRKSKEWYMI